MVRGLLLTLSDGTVESVDLLYADAAEVDGQARSVTVCRDEHETGDKDAFIRTVWRDIRAVEFVYY